jgi:hypothetical protein
VWLGKQDSNHSITLHVSLLIEPTWCAGWDFELKALFAAYVEAMQRQNVLDYGGNWTPWLAAAHVPEALRVGLGHQRASGLSHLESRV